MDLSICSRILYHWAIPPWISYQDMLFNRFGLSPLPVIIGRQVRNLQCIFDTKIENNQKICRIYLMLGLFRLQNFPFKKSETNILISKCKAPCINLYNIESTEKIIIYNSPKMWKKMIRGHTELNHGPLDLQSNALPLSYTPFVVLSISMVLLICLWYHGWLVNSCEIK